MKVLKRIAIVFFGVVILTTTGLFVYLWPVDPRLSGTFQSDAENTIEYIKSTRKVTERQLNIYNQIFGHLFYEFNGHKIKIIVKPHKIKGYPENFETINEGSTEESYFFIKKSLTTELKFFFFLNLGGR